MALPQVQLDGLLKQYFFSWRPYKLILSRLEEVHNIKRSLSWLKQQYRRLNLSRRPTQYTPEGIVKNCIRRELRSSNSQLGYRAIWKLLRDKYQVICKRDTVMVLLRELDSDGVLQRKSRRLTRRVYFSKGPNFLWHMDGYDKLSPFGFCIHGCIDGFSRRMIWLHVAATNNDPAVILHYYLESVEKLKGCPSAIRMDRGTENIKVAEVQYTFREYDSDEFAAEKSFRFGTSPANIRIEGWWSQLVRHKTGWWIRVFKELEQQSAFNRYYDTHRKCLVVVFLPIIERELNEFVQHWNSHRIRPSRQGNCIGGIPDDLYQMPQHYGTQDYLKRIDAGIWTLAMATKAKKPPLIFDDDFYQTCHALVLQQFNIDLFRDVSVSNCLSVYEYLRDNV